MSYMFDGCTRLESVDLSGFQTENVTTMQYMFRNCTALRELDLGTFNTKNLNYMCEMFNGCTNLVTIYASKDFTTSSLNLTGTAGDTNIFKGCNSLVGGAGSRVTGNNVRSAYARIDGNGGAGYFTDVASKP